MMEEDWELLYQLGAVVGLTAITIITRGFFMIPKNELPLPDWLKRGLKYAPLATLTAVIAPEVLMANGEVIHTVLDARLPALIGATCYYVKKRGILGTIVIGMLIYLPLHLGLGW